MVCKISKRFVDARSSNFSINKDEGDDLGLSIIVLKSNKYPMPLKTLQKLGKKILSFKIQYNAICIKNY